MKETTNWDGVFGSFDKAYRLHMGTDVFCSMLRFHRYHNDLTTIYILIFGPPMFDSITKTPYSPLLYAKSLCEHPSSLSIGLGLRAISPVSSSQSLILAETKRNPPKTYGIYCILYSSSKEDLISSGSWPETLIAYTPGTYPSKRCHFATHDLAGLASVIKPSKTWDVQLSIWSCEPMRCRNSSQLGHPSSRKRCRDLGGQQWLAFLGREERRDGRCMS